MMKRTYQETLNYMYSLLPMYQNVGKEAFKKDLTNIKALCEVLGNPQENLRMIHIAGTNGKGSTSHILASLLQAQFDHVGMYTSPHYKSFRERIKIYNCLISEDYIVDFIDNIQGSIEKIKPSFFEITVAMAFQYFYDTNVDIAVIEVGLGGRLDSTNIIDPLLSVITNISLDHTSMLGNTLEEIAVEKGGIIKPNRSVVIGERQEETTEIYQKLAKNRGANLIFAEDIITSSVHNDDITMTFNNKSWHFKANWWVPYQKKNTVTALAAYSTFLNENNLGFRLKREEELLSKMPTATYFVGRWQKLSDYPLLIADSAHNLEGFMQVLRNIEFHNINQLHIVIGFSNDKSIDDLLDVLPNDAQYYFAKANVPRGLDAQHLKSQAEKYGLVGDHYDNVEDALHTAKKNYKEGDLILITGSIFVVAEVL